MWQQFLPLVFGMILGCAYVTKGELDHYRDRDEDGWPLDDDCNDTDSRIHPYAGDYRGDGCDADCGKGALDSDMDDWPDDVDCGPDDPDQFPCNPDEVDGDKFDSDCDGEDGIRDLEEFPCMYEDPNDPEAPDLSSYSGNCDETNLDI
ncbi:MAG: hypothetical protein HN348_17830 [Proteobacteria bacterium]|jgi:hypothetical protein|nr:hypothetical protein [Pseudomonadota bacterium]